METQALGVSQGWNSQPHAEAWFRALEGAWEGIIGLQGPLIAFMSCLKARAGLRVSLSTGGLGYKKFQDFQVSNDILLGAVCMPCVLPELLLKQKGRDARACVKFLGRRKRV